MATTVPSVRHDRESDAVYVRLSEGTAARTTILDDLRMIDLAEDGTIIGFEFLDVSDGIDLTEVPLRSIVEKLIEPFGFRVFA